MKHILTHKQLFERAYIKHIGPYNEVEDTIENIKKSLDEFGIKNYTVHEDGTVDVDGNVNLSDKNLDKIPFKFGKVTGFFDCSNNNLTSLKGCPSEVRGGNFNCNNNKLMSLEFSPKIVGGDFNCFNNELMSLEFSPKIVGGSFICYSGNLTSIEHCPESVGGDFNCMYNKLPLETEKPDGIDGWFLIHPQL